MMGKRDMLLRGYSITDTFADSGDLVTVPAGSGYLGLNTVTILSQVVPSGVSIFFESLSCRSFDIDMSQIAFSLRRNGTPPLRQCAKMEGAMFAFGQFFKIDNLLPPGTYEIHAYNLTGTSLPGAIPAVDVVCQASWFGNLCVREQPLKLSGEFFSTSFKTQRRFLK